MSTKNIINAIQRMATHLELSITVIQECDSTYGNPIIECCGEMVTCNNIRGYWYWLQEFN